MRRAWDDYLSEGRLDRVRQPIAESWHRSQIAGVDPCRSRAPTMTDPTEVAARWEAHPLNVAAPLVRRWLGAVAAGSEHLLVATDADGVLLWIDGDVRMRSAAADGMNLVEGSVWSEAAVGTSGIGTALAADHPVQVHAAEHFSELFHPWSCSAAPVHDPDDGRLLGVIDLTAAISKAHLGTVAAALAAACAVEADLRVRAQERDARLRLRYLERMASAGGKLALVSRSGRVIADHPDGFLHAARVALPAGGGAIVLADGCEGYAEALDRDDAYIVYARGGRCRSRAPRRAAEADATESESGWRRAQLELSQLAEEQAALRRAATLVAGQATAEEIFATVAEEVARLLRADRGAVCRYTEDGTMTVLAHWTRQGGTLPVGTRVKRESESDSVAALVRQSGQPSRVDGPRATVGAPILAEGRVWGAVLAAWTGPLPLAKETETRLMGFAELVATAISNAVTRAELNASRARIVTAADETRRRIQRNLHDGAQQRLVSIALELRAAAGDASASRDELARALLRAADAVTAAVDELRELARGIHPAALSERGLAPVLRTLSRRSAIPVELEISTPERFADHIEAAAYYVVSELLTNATRHARASAARVAVGQLSGVLHVSVHDDGVGGADPARGTGLIGLRDRVEALGGTISVESPIGGGTAVLVCLPLDGFDSGLA